MLKTNSVETIDFDITEDKFGPLFPYIKDENISSIEFDGTNAWINMNNGQKYKSEELTSSMTKNFVRYFVFQIAHGIANKAFNKENTIVSIQNKTVCISITHESQCEGYHAISIKKI